MSNKNLDHDARYRMRVMMAFTCVLCSTAAANAPETEKSDVQKFISAIVADSQTTFFFEIFVASLVVAYAFGFVYGSYVNLNLARKVAHTLHGILDHQFVEFGTADGKTLLKDGPSYYWYHATGRRYTSGLTVLMDFAKRMDLFSYTSSFMTAPQRDRIVFYMPITEDVSMDPLTLFIVKRKELSRLKDVQEGQALKSVEQFAGEVVDVNGLPDDFVTMTEHSDIIAAILPERIRTVIARQSRNLLSLHVTENGAKWDAQCSASKRLIRIEFILPWQQKHLPQVLEDMSQIAIQLLDTVSETKISAAARKKAVELRRKVQQEVEKKLQKARAEEAATRRLAKKKEEEEAVGKMSREKQIKYEEKKRKKELNSRMRKTVRR
eukprot:TRINITY_DN79389_c0_g1_i1.p1 TRINITY_DN79389_c0_g1~~TRINITY_DN79389_c0_g1_i1.p1  ORF type:complete len:380 (-),score=79.39 TRINITY_DN79389_c0_g1_i1:1256-2395(-)